MNIIPDWAYVSPYFDWDGSWRDICILDTTQAHWNAVVNLLQNSSYQWSLYVGGDPLTSAAEGGKIPDFDTLVVRSDRLMTHMKFAISDISIKCHFFEDDKIEFDIDPRDVGAANWPELVTFLFDLSRVTGKPCLLTEENCPHLWLVKANAVSGEMQTARSDSSLYGNRNE